MKITITTIATAIAVATILAPPAMAERDWKLCWYTVSTTDDIKKTSVEWITHKNNMGEYVVRPVKQVQSDLADFEVKLNTRKSYLISLQSIGGVRRSFEFSPPISCSDRYLNALRLSLYFDPEIGDIVVSLRGNDSPFSGWRD